jgi:YesN/AraC family two-component response regulator
MIVEDDRAAIEILAFMIPRKYPQFTVELAFDGQMGLELFKERRPDLVITDINMPKMDGIRMSEGIKEIAPDTRIIVMTAYSDKIHQDKFSELGISDYLLKPIEFGKLFAAIEKATKELRPERC